MADLPLYMRLAPVVPGLQVRQRQPGGALPRHQLRVPEGRGVADGQDDLPHLAPLQLRTHLQESVLQRLQDTVKPSVQN